MLTITRRATFAAGHRLYRPDWDDAHNLEVFGACANPGGHGHNYTIEVTVTGALDPASGMIVDLTWLKQVIQRELLDHVDHRNLNRDVPFLHDLNPTAENLVVAFFRRLHGPISERAHLLRLQLTETENNVATYEEP